jgi:hypothetical protein
MDKHDEAVVATDETASTTNNQSVINKRKGIIVYKVNDKYKDLKVLNVELIKHGCSSIIDDLKFKFVSNNCLMIYASNEQNINLI